MNKEINIVITSSPYHGYTLRVHAVGEDPKYLEPAQALEFVSRKIMRYKYEVEAAERELLDRPESCTRRSNSSYNPFMPNEWDGYPDE